MSGLKGYLHLAGSPETPKNSEYEIHMAGVSSFLAIYNAVLFDESFLRVIDERKPVLAIVHSIEDESIWKFDSHIGKKGRNSGNCSAKPILSSDAGVMIYSEIEYHKPQYIKLRIDNEVYFAGDTSQIFGEVHTISFEDVLLLLSGEINWGNLKGRSYLHERKITKEKSCPKKNAQLVKELKAERKNSEGLHFRLNELTYQMEKQTNAHNLTSQQLEKVPVWIRRLFKAI